MWTYMIIAVTVGVSVACFRRVEWFGRLALRPERVMQGGEWWRVLTHGFVHADWGHLLVNLFTYWSFGVFVESAFVGLGFGEWAYLVLYFGGMVVAAVPDVVRYRRAPWYASVGASGAVSAVLFTAIFLMPLEIILVFGVIPVPGIVFGVVYLVYCQYMARRGEGRINHRAHFYGAVFGFVFPILLKPELFGRFLGHFMR